MSCYDVNQKQVSRDEARARWARNELGELRYRMDKAKTSIAAWERKGQLWPEFARLQEEVDRLKAMREEAYGRMLATENELLRVYRARLHAARAS